MRIETRLYAFCFLKRKIRIIQQQKAVAVSVICRSNNYTDFCKSNPLTAKIPVSKSKIFENFWHF